jgi:hypothetical protein
MDKGYIDGEGNYYEGDRQRHYKEGRLIPDQEVPRRPSAAYRWDNQSWAFNFEAWLDLEVRPERDRLLRESDWTQILDSPLDDKKKSEWAQYRQSLRDFPLIADSKNLAWPGKPK